MSFESDIEKFAKRTNNRAEKVRRAVTLQMFTAIIKLTPVDKGMLRGNWQTTIGEPASGTLDVPDVSGDATVAKTANVLGWSTDPNRPIYMTNNLPYAAVAEYGLWNGATDKVTSRGFSRKASRGMVRINTIRFKKLLDVTVSDALNQ